MASMPASTTAATAINPFCSAKPSRSAFFRIARPATTRNFPSNHEVRRHHRHDLQLTREFRVVCEVDGVLDNLDSQGLPGISGGPLRLYSGAARDSCCTS